MPNDVVTKEKTTVKKKPRQGTWVVGAVVAVVALFVAWPLIGLVLRGAFALLPLLQIVIILAVFGAGFFLYRKLAKQEEGGEGRARLLTGLWIVLSAFMLLAIFRLPLFTFLIFVLPFWLVVSAGLYFFIIKEK